MWSQFVIVSHTKVFVFIVEQQNVYLIQQISFPYAAIALISKRSQT